MLYAVIGKVNTQTQGQKKVCVFKSENQSTSNTHKNTFNAALLEDLKLSIDLNTPGFAASIDGTIVANAQLSYVMNSPYLQNHLDVA